MHRSRIGMFLIDHPAPDWERSLAFWRAVTGEPDHGDQDDEYRSLGSLGVVRLESQRTGAGTPARVHLDIETDDVAAEVARVVGLGARRVEDRDDYTILEDPGGLVFCVVPIQTGEDFERYARMWE